MTDVPLFKRFSWILKSPNVLGPL